MLLMQLLRSGRGRVIILLLFDTFPQGYTSMCTACPFNKKFYPLVGGSLALQDYY